MLHWWRIERVMGPVLTVLLAGLLLAACGGDPDNGPPDTPVPTLPPTSVLQDIITWTPAPTVTPRPTLTLAPTRTSAVSAPTFPPPPETGLSEQAGQTIVTLLEADLNEVIAEAYRAAGDQVESSGPPRVTFEPGTQLAIEVSFTNPFLEEDITVHIRTVAAIIDGRIRLRELQERRDWSGPTPSNPAVWSVIDLVERGINEAVFDVLRGQPGASGLTLISLRQFPDSPQIRARLEAVFAE